MPEVELDPQKTYKMPTPIFIESLDGKHLVIARETANWLLLHNDQQLRVFSLLEEGKSIATLLDSFPAEEINDILEVLLELEAKRFESTDIQYTEENGMYIYLTNSCNQRCHHCYMHAGDAEVNELTTEEIQCILYEFSKSGGELVTFTGGEPTLRNDFKEIVHAAKKAGLNVCVLSNGLLWTQELVDNVKDHIDEVQISVDGFDAESYKTVRGVNTFSNALEAVDKLLKANVRVIVAITPLLDDLLENKSKYSLFAKSLTKKYEKQRFLVKFNTMLMEGRGISLTGEENDQYRDIIKAIKSEYDPLSAEKDFALAHINNTVFNNCGYGGLCVAANGNVYFCSIIRKCAKQANIRSHSFASLIEQSNKARAFSNVNNLYPCNKCDLKYLCGGGCRIKHFPELLTLSFDDFKTLRSFTRSGICKKEDKEKIYRLMIAANKLFYREI